MRDEELDRLIDNAAGQMLSHQPSRPLKGVVMARLRDPKPSGHRRLAWAAAAASVVACVSLGIALISKAPVPQTQRPPAAPAAAVRLPDRPSIVSAQESPALRTPSPVAVARRNPLPIRLLPNDASSIEPLEMEPIVMPVVDVPPLESETVSIDRLDIETLTIEPLSASND